MPGGITARSACLCARKLGRCGVAAAAVACAAAPRAVPDVPAFTCRTQVLFVQGGASTQFAALPLNFAPEGATVDYVVTGAWGAKCVKTAAAALPPCGV